ncbi:hypothetical protein BDZ97DRAFT_1809769 [Flammula alnicola]|nr:hypothetical protein BDZ97DRAFT_1809769 [Flammula alnicola]
MGFAECGTQAEFFKSATPSTTTVTVEKLDLFSLPNVLFSLIMEVDDGSNNSKPVVESEWVQLEELPRPFDTVSADLAALGALSIEDFLSNAASTSAVYDISFYLQLPEPPPPEKEKETEKEKDSKPTDVAEDPKASAGKPIRGPVALLRQTSQSMFGSGDCLKWEYLEEGDPKNKQCILTITRPNGATRSYKSDSGFSRRGEAKAQAAQIAIDMGAIDFVISGDSDALKTKKGLLLNPFDVEIDNMESDEATAGPIPKFSDEEEPLRLIEDCCTEWRPGKVKPHWVSYNDTKNKKKHGAALRIALTPHVFRAYSVDPVHNSVKAAKIACAKTALEEGVIDFIQYGNGQTEPAKVVDDGLEEVLNSLRDSPPPLKGVTLQEFYETLPQPFPEDVGEMGAAEINAPAWLNITLQSARGGRLVSSFTPVIDSARHLHGCILRIERPEETRTYLVDPQFPKRSDAKSAVCLLAMSQGVGDYIRGLKEEAENKLPADKRKLANEKLLQVLAAECGKVRPGNRLHFNFTSERDAFGCILKVDLSSSASEPDVREYCVKTEYRTKADAKAAVACLAAEQGLVDLLRFRGATPPSDYVPFWEAQMNGDGDSYVPKRKEPERDLDSEGRDRKKRRKGNKDNGSEPNEASGLQPTPKLKQPPQDLLPPKPVTVVPPNYPSNARWKKPHATGSRGLGSTNAYASAPRSVGQDRSGSRSGGVSQHPHSYHPMSSSSAPSSYDPHPHAHPYDDRTGYGPGPAYQPAPAYAQPDPYGNVYPHYPIPPGQSHYPNPIYHSPPPPPPHPYPAYYAAPSPPPPTPPHAPYGHYAYPPHYPQQYPHAPYSGSYSHPPVLYSPPPPPPLMAMGHPPAHSASAPPDPYPPPRYRSHYSSRSPPPLPPSPPHHMHHLSHPSHPIDYNSYEESRQMNNRRRHSAMGDSRPRVNGFQSRPPDGTDRGRYEGREPSPSGEPPVATWWHDRPPPNYPSRPHNYLEQPVHEVPVTKESEGLATGYPPSNGEIGNVQSTPQSGLEALYEFCEKEKIPRPAFFYEVIEEKDGAKKYTVWAEKDSQRLELQNHFSSVEEGYEKLSKRVLQWERSRLE